MASTSNISAQDFARRPWRTMLRHRPTLGWLLYDWANSPFVLTIITVIGSAYFVGVFEHTARESGDLHVGPAPALLLGGVKITAEAAWSLTIALSGLVVALSSPLLGALADRAGTRWRFMATYCTVGALAAVGLYLHLPWWGIALLILLGNVGFEGGNVFYNAWLPELGPGPMQDRLSSMGYALGYIGGLVVLGVSLAMFVPPRGDVRHAFVLVGLWWAAFGWLSMTMLPPQRTRLAGQVGALALMRQIFRDLLRYPQAARMLLAFMVYNDGIVTLISNVTPYALQNIYEDAARTQPISITQLTIVIMLVQFLASVGSIFCGWLSTRIGEKATIVYTLCQFAVVVTYGLVADSLLEFYVMAVFIGWVLGGAQATSRALFSMLIPAEKSTEFFGFFAMSSKFSAVVGPLIYSGLILWTGDTRYALFSLVVFFVLGAALLMGVRVPQGVAQAGQGA